MKRHIAPIAALLILGCASVHAEDTKKVTPGTAPTGAVGDQVQDMKGDCADNAKVDTKAPGTEATEAMGTQVPDMKQADASDCNDAMQNDATPKSDSGTPE